MKKEELRIKRFNEDLGFHFIIGFSHLYLNENSEITFAAGERPTKEHLEKLEAYLKRNKISFKEYKGVIIK